MSATAQPDAWRPGAMHVTTDGPGGREMLERHREEWQRTYRAAANEPSDSFEWTAALCRSHVADDEPLQVIRVARDESPLAFVALTTRRVTALGRPVVLATPISEHYLTHSSIVAGERTIEVADAIVGALQAQRTQWDLFRMATLLEADAWLPLLEGALRRQRVPFSLRDSFPSYVLPLPDTFDAYLATRSSKFRNHLKRTSRKVEALGRCEIVDSTDAPFGDVFAQLLAVERHSWKHGHGSAISAVARQAGFFDHLVQSTGEPSPLHVQVLCIDGRPVAHNLGYRRGDTYFYLKTSFDDEFRTAGVATYLRAKLFDALMARGVRVIDFPAEPYEWERQWADDVRWHKTLVVYGRTVTGRALRLVDAVRRRHAAERRLTYWDPRDQRPVDAE